MHTDVSSAVSFFKESWKHYTVTEVTTGHIHRSFVVAVPEEDPIFLQEFNINVFPKYQAIFSNVKLICNELLQNQYPLEVPVPLSGRNGEYCMRDGEVKVWRAFAAIKDAYSINTADTAERVYRAAQAFAWFQKSLSNILPNQLEEPIVGFMDNPGRLAKLQEAIAADAHKRLASCQSEVAFVLQNTQNMQFIYSSRSLPGNAPRATHGDMKLNNILFNTHTHRPQSIIDLDTCMIGDYLYDYGDFMRIACSMAAEDEPDIQKVDIHLSYVNAALEGFRDGFPTALPDSLWKDVKRAAAEVTLTIGTRFLTDYLNGDKYFRISTPLHNLVRARCQLALFKRWLAIL